MLLRDYRVGYTQNFEETQTARDWSWQSFLTMADAEIQFENWRSSHFAKQKMSGLLIMKVEFDVETGESTAKIMQKINHKLHKVVHYNKKDDLPKAAPVYAQVPISPAPTVAGTPEPSNTQLISAYLSHLAEA